MAGTDHATIIQLRRLIEILTKRVEALEKEGKTIAIGLGNVQHELYTRFGNH